MTDETQETNPTEESAAAPEPTPVEEPVVEDAAPASAEPVAASEEAAPAAEEAPSTDEAAVPQLTLGADAPASEADGEPEPAAAPTIRGRVDKHGVAMGTGRRKTSVARVRIKEGDGKLTINGRSLEEYFTLERDQKMVQAPLEATEQLGKVDVWVRVNGGGTTGQTGAVVLGVARALQVMNPELHHHLAEGGYLTRDGRMVERKKYGFKKARRSFQFSKR